MMAERERIARLLQLANATEWKTRDAIAERHPVPYPWMTADQPLFYATADALLAARDKENAERDQDMFVTLRADLTTARERVAELEKALARAQAELAQWPEVADRMRRDALDAEAREGHCYRCDGPGSHLAFHEACLRDYMAAHEKIAVLLPPAAPERDALDNSDPRPSR